MGRGVAADVKATIREHSLRNATGYVEMRIHGTGFVTRAPGKDVSAAGCVWDCIKKLLAVSC